MSQFWHGLRKIHHHAYLKIIEQFRFHFVCHAERSEMTFQQSGESSKKTKRNRYKILSIIHDACREKEQAISAAQKAVELELENLEFIVNLSTILQNSEEIEEAGKVLNSVLETYSDWIGGHRQLARIYESCGEL